MREREREREVFFTGVQLSAGNLPGRVRCDLQLLCAINCGEQRHRERHKQRVDSESRV